jgi:hypothetical protein
MDSVLRIVLFVCLLRLSLLRLAFDELYSMKLWSCIVCVSFGMMFS